MIAKILTLLSSFIIWAISSSGYLGIILMMAIESACIPLPSEVIMPFSGYLVYTGQLDLFWVATAGAFGCNVGSVAAYEVGYFGGRRLVEKYGSYILLSQTELAWADGFFARYGAAAVFLARLLPVVRTFIALPAGIARMPRVPFHLYTFLGSWPWCFALAWLGMKAGENWQYLGKYFHEFDVVIGAVIVLGAAWFVYSRMKHRVRAS